MTATFYPDQKDFSFYDFRQQFGLLHDADLIGYLYQDDLLSLEFGDLYWYEHEFSDKTLYAAYKDFTTCKIQIRCKRDSSDSFFVLLDNHVEMIKDTGMKASQKNETYTGSRTYRLNGLDKIDLSDKKAEFLDFGLSIHYLRLNFLLLGKQGSDTDMVLKLFPKSVTFLWE